MRRVLAEGHLVEEAALAEEVAVVGDEDHHRVLDEPRRLERVQNLADPLVDVGQARVVAVACGPDVLLGDLDLVHRGRAPEAALVRIELLVGLRRGCGRVDLVLEEQLPVAAARDVGVVGMAERDAEAERGVVLEAGVVVQATHRVERDLVVVLELVRDLSTELMLWYHQSTRSSGRLQSGVHPKSPG